MAAEAFSPPVHRATISFDKTMFSIAPILFGSLCFLKVTANAISTLFASQPASQYDGKSVS
ncbi:hypothetical protein GE21DRAFT_1283741 [Neurospora crassa]|nr:hypothetical protein GE21DRAFT_1283741 [Neurospora crassa]